MAKEKLFYITNNGNYKEIKNKNKSDFLYIGNGYQSKSDVNKLFYLHNENGKTVLSPVFNKDKKEIYVKTNKKEFKKLNN